MKVTLFVTILSLSIAGCLVTREQVRETVRAPEPTPAQQTKAASVASYQELEEQLRVMNGRVETLENSMNLLNAAKSGSNVEMNEEKRALNEKLKIYEEAITKLEAQVLLLSQKLESRSDSASSKSSEKTLSSYELAVQDFDNKRWKEAIVSFEKYRTLNPKGRRYSEATYKIGASFFELGMKAEARAFYSEVVEKFPKSEWATKARQRLKAL